jgi:glucokinase
MYLSTTGADPSICAFPRVVGDIGGTNARFAVQAVQGGPLEQVQKLACKDFPGFSAALTHYRSGLGLSVRAGAFGIANPVTGPDLRMTNHPWAFSIEAVRSEQGLEALLFLNDFTALSLGLGRMRREGLRRDVFERYIGEIAKAVHAIMGADPKAIYDALLEQANAHAEVLGVVGWVDLLAADAPHRIADLARHPKL